MKEWIVNLLTSHGKAHNLVLVMTSCTFAGSVWRCQDATMVGVVGGTLATLYGANAWAGTKSTPPAA